MIDLMQLHEMVWAWRRQMEPHFPTPDPEDSLRFAVTEAGEAMDAHLRQNDRYVRNRDKAHSVERELAQCAMMLLTAFPQAPRALSYHYSAIRPALTDVCYYTAAALYDYPQGSWSLNACNALGTIAGMVPDLPDELAAALEQLRQKHQPKEPTGGI